MTTFLQICVAKLKMYVRAKSLQSHQTLCDPMDCSPPGSSVYGILQARILEWVTFPFSRGSSQPRDRTQVSPALQAYSLGIFPTQGSNPGLTHIAGGFFAS